MNTGNEASYPTSVVSVSTPNVGVSSEDANDKDKKEIERLRSTSSLYKKYAELWDFFLASYEGGPKFADTKNIFKHPREHPDDFNERAKRLYYHNYCYPLVDFFTTFIFTETIHRDAGKTDQATYNAFITDVNKKGEDITSFMMQVSDDMQIFGMSYILVDTPPKPEGVTAMTQAQQDEMALRPYWVLVKPNEVLDWAVDSFDNFTYLKRKEFQTRINPDFTQQIIERYSEWLPSQIKVSEIDITDPEKPQLLGSKVINNEIGLIPFHVTRYKRSKTDKFMGLSFLNDIAWISREVMNLTSMLQEFLYRQCFNILAMESDPNVPEIEQMQGEISTANMLKYAQGTKEPKYITPPVQPAEFLQSERASNVMAMYKIAAQDTQNDLFNGHKSSGYSKSQSFQTTVPKIATRAEALEATEMRLMDLTYKYLGKTWAGAIKYKDHYQITNLTDALAQLSTLFKDLQINSETFAEMQMKRMVDEFDGKMSAENREKVYAEIEAINWKEWFDVQKLALLGRAAASPEAGLVIDPTGIKAPAAPASAPVKGKDTPTAASTKQRASSGSSEIKKESEKGKK